MTSWTGAAGRWADVGPEDAEVRMVISRAKLAQRPWHRAKLHLVLSAMQRFAGSLEHEGFEVRVEVADTLAAGMEGAVDPVVMALSSWDLRQALDRMGIEQVPNDAFVVGEAAFHSLLSVPLNLGLLHPREVCDAVDARWRDGRRDVPRRASPTPRPRDTSTG